MALTTGPICNFGWKAKDFRLAGTDGRVYSLADVRGPKGTLIAFICVHCPYVKAIHGKLVREANALREIGVGFAAIMANHNKNYAEDTFENMIATARTQGYMFPYLYDPTQKTTRAFGAVCTPDFFGFNADDELQYRGRLDEAGKTDLPNARRELFEAMKAVAGTGKAPKEQTPTIGCSIEWLDEAAD